jgi:hypothetical protein
MEKNTPVSFIPISAIYIIKIADIISTCFFYIFFLLAESRIIVGIAAIY